MLPDHLRELTVPAALDAWDADAVTGASREFGETALWIRPERIVPVCQYLKDIWQFSRLTALSAIDRCPLEPRFEVFYLVHSIGRNERLRLKVALTGTAGSGYAVDSVTGVWAGANWYERETYDLFGIVFRGHPNLSRIMLPADWQGHPLRKDYPIHGHKYDYQFESPAQVQPSE